MKTLVKATLMVGFMALSSVGCGDDDDDGEVTQPNDAGLDASRGNDGGAEMDARVDSAAPDAAVALTEAQVVGVATALNNGEIEAGELAMQKATSQAVKDFAGMMVTMHGAANARAAALGIAPAPSAPAQQVEQMNQTVAQTLMSTPTGAEFDRAYVASQVVAHTMALNAFDTLLIPNATTPALEAELTRARGEVEAHLRMAQALRGDGG